MSPSYPGFGRRRFVQGLAGVGVIGASGLAGRSAQAEAAADPSMLSGAHFGLVIDETPANVTGRRRMANTSTALDPDPPFIGARAIR